MKTKTAWSSKKLVSAYNTRQCDNPEDTIWSIFCFTVFGSYVRACMLL
jgi:hypothetical protein